VRAPRFTLGAFRLAATAAAGVLAGHFVGYRLVFTGSPQRHAALVETGHGYFPLAIRVAAMLAVVAGAASLARGYARARENGDAIPAPRATAFHLAVLQVFAFVGLEFVERIVTGVPFHHFLLPVLIVGAVAQIVIAAGGAALIAALYRVGAAIAGSFAPDEAAAVSPIWRPVLHTDVASRVLAAPAPIRGPPLLLPMAL
jgi:hypothetical protein